MWAQEAFSGDIMNLKREADFLLTLLNRVAKKLVHKRLNVFSPSFELFFCKASMNNIIVFDIPMTSCSYCPMVAFTWPSAVSSSFW